MSLLISDTPGTNVAETIARITEQATPKVDTSAITPEMVNRAAALTTVKRVKLDRDVRLAISEMDAAMSRVRDAETEHGLTSPEALDAWQHVSTLGLTIGRRSRILGGLPRGG